ncbi:MAG: hypothetical protein EA397_08020 [Deltaproteobacteria bacterium]|nr:MAG: hypothetical protein EA397_08020 [Deltaproteobacteria bacterium]
MNKMIDAFGRFAKLEHERLVAHFTERDRMAVARGDLMFWRRHGGEDLVGLAKTHPDPDQAWFARNEPNATAHQPRTLYTIVMHAHHAHGEVFTCYASGTRVRRRMLDRRYVAVLTDGVFRVIGRADVNSTDTGWDHVAGVNGDTLPAPSEIRVLETPPNSGLIPHAG